MVTTRIEGSQPMSNPDAVATAYMEKLEADRRAAIEISEQKAMEAKLIAARQDGFRAAMDIFRGAIPVNSCEPQPEKLCGRKQRRDIRELILRELSFSGDAMTTSQIAKAIDYLPERTETALKRLENNEKIARNEKGRWTALVMSVPEPNGYAVSGATDKLLTY
jgi:hypothetical protein